MFKSKLWQDRLLSITSTHSHEHSGQFRSIGNFNKMSGNFLKHNVTFEEASSCIVSTNAITFKDKICNVLIEPRFNLIALSDQHRILFVVFCIRDRGSQKRIISARRANRKERLRLLTKFPEITA